MKRKDIAYCYANVFPLCDMQKIDFAGIMRVIGYVSKWRKRNGYPKPADMNPEVRDGSLYMNGKRLGRIIGCARGYGEQTAYYNGLVIAKAGL